MTFHVLEWAFSMTRGRKLRPATMLVLLALAHCHNSETGRCDPSNAHLRAKTGLSERAIRDALRELEQERLIATTHRTLRTGRGRRNLRSRYNFRDGAKSAGGVGQNLPPNKEISTPTAFFDLRSGPINLLERSRVS